MSKMRFGVIGSGSWATWYGNALKDSEAVELVAVTGGRRATEFAQKFGVRQEEDVEELLTADDVEGVIVVCPHGLHADYTVAAAQAGKHVLVEKPMATTVADCDRMIQAAQQAGIKLQVAHSRRFFPIIRKAKEILESGTIGDLIMMEQTFCHDARNFGAGEGWMADPDLSMGFMIGYGCHQLDASLWFAGARVKHVLGRFSNYWKDTPVENFGAFFMAFENGVYSNFWEFCSMPNDLGKWPPFPGLQEEFKIVGSKGLMLVQSYEKLMLRTGEQWETVLQLTPKEADPITTFLREEVEALAHSVATDTPPPVTGEEGKHTVEVCLAAYESSKTGRPVTIGEA